MIVKRNQGKLIKALVIDKGAGYQGEERFAAERRFEQEAPIPKTEHFDGGRFEYALPTGDFLMVMAREEFEVALGNFFG